MKTKLTYGSLFSGVGGFDMGFDQENYECVFQVEWDKHCQNILAKHWPEVPKWSDVQDVNGAEIPPCDVLTFGSPCQDLSVAGKRAGLEGTKSSMFYEATRIIKEMRNATESIYPRVVIWENVPGALSSNNGADFGAVIDTLADIGAVDIQWSVLDAQHFGVPQRRRRIFVVAIFDPATSDRCPDPLLPVIKGSRGDFAKGRKAQQNAARSADVSIETGGQWWDGETTADCLTTTSNEQRMPDKNRLQAVLVPNEIIGALCARDYKGVGNQYVDEGKLVVEDAVVPLKTSNTKANGMNVGEPGDPMYTLDTGNSLAVAYKFDSLASNSMKSANPNSGCNEADIAPTLDTWTPDPSLNQGGIAIVEKTLGPVAYSIREDAKNNNFSATETDVALCLNGLQPSTQSHHAQLFIAEPIVYDGYDQKADFSGTHRTLRVGRDSGDFVAQPIIFENSFRDGPRIGDDVCHTLPAKMGSGGGNTPMLAFDPEIIGPLTSSGMSRARGTESVESNHVLAINTPMLAVRRLTPLECERLMGWPDDHTRFYADGTEQADTHRYKQCGNGVATPVAKWIAKHLKNILITNDNE
jgi:DNA (cytosine-5)-methyltransferase 1